MCKTRIKTISSNLAVILCHGGILNESSQLVLSGTTRAAYAECTVHLEVQLRDGMRLRRCEDWWIKQYSPSVRPIPTR